MGEGFIQTAMGEMPQFPPPPMGTGEAFVNSLKQMLQGLGLSERLADEYVLNPAAEKLGEFSTKIPTEFGKKAVQGLGTAGLVAAGFGLDPFNAFPAGKGAKLTGKLAESVFLREALKDVPEHVIRRAEMLEKQYGLEALERMAIDYKIANAPFLSHDLPMDTASRMARAKELGYTTDAFHGRKGKNPILEFDEDYLGSNTGAADAELAHFFNTNPEAAGGYTRGPGSSYVSHPTKPSYITEQIRWSDEGGQIIPVKINTEGIPVNNRMVKIVGGGGYSPDDFEHALKANLKKAEKTKGSQSLVIKNVRDAGYSPAQAHPEKVVGDVIAINPSETNRIRSTSAAFDPRMKHSSNILATALAALLGKEALDNNEQQ
jgi:hypothetical protein